MQRFPEQRHHASWFSSGGRGNQRNDFVPSSLELGKIPGAQLASAEEPERRAEGEVRAEGKNVSRLPSGQKNPRDTGRAADDRGGEDREEDRLPSEKSTDTGKEFYVAEPHRLAGDHDGLERPAEDVQFVEVEFLVPGLDPIIVETQRPGRQQPAVADGAGVRRAGWLSLA